MGILIHIFRAQCDTFLKDFQKLLDEGRTPVFGDETWVPAHITNTKCWQVGSKLDIGIRSYAKMIGTHIIQNYLIISEIKLLYTYQYQ